MIVTAYFTTEDKRKLNKVLTSITTLDNVNLLQDTSKLNPVFVFEGVLDKEVNYLYVPDFNRYYFVNDIRILNGGQLTELTCHVDVLMSFKNDILDTFCIIERATSNTNSLIVDSQTPVQCNTKTINKKLSQGEMLSTITPENVSFILSCY